MSVLFLPEAEEYLVELTKILYQKEYFGFKESATRYVTELVWDIINSLLKKTTKEAPPYFDKYGANMYYASFRKNKSTQWYVFFTKNDDVYYINYIANNHTVAQYIKY